ncbi:MAG: EAL domain-containing protein, partial [Pseudomonadota bacterium]|nr:EAL domain-containing protein [Pseudomonadota bacterium]
MSGALPEQLNNPELELLTPLLTRDSSGWTANYLGLVLRTALQPIYSIPHKRVVGYEALIRAFDTDNAPVLPSHLFDLPANDADNLLLD